MSDPVTPESVFGAPARLHLPDRVGPIEEAALTGDDLISALNTLVADLGEDFEGAR